MSATKTLLTAEQFDNYPFEEDKRYELDEGELMEMTRPAYKHNQVLTVLTGELYLYFKGAHRGHILVSENLYAIAPITRLAPDVAVILGDRRKELNDAKVIPIIPEIVVEVLSPRERSGRIQRKLNQYLQAGVKEVWFIDPEDRTAEIWIGPERPDRVLTTADFLSSPLLPGFTLRVEELFS
jgi:Uma2 family endonuclease